VCTQFLEHAWREKEVQAHFIETRKPVHHKMDEAEFMRTANDLLGLEPDLAASPKRKRKRKPKKQEAGTFKLPGKVAGKAIHTIDGTIAPHGVVSKPYKSLTAPLDMVDSDCTMDATHLEKLPGWIRTLYVVFEAINTLYSFAVHHRDASSTSGISFTTIAAGIKPILEEKNCPETLSGELLLLLCFIAGHDLLSTGIFSQELYVYMEGTRVLKRKRLEDTGPLYEISRKNTIFLQRLSSVYSSFKSQHEGDDEVRRALLMASTEPPITPMAPSNIRPDSLLSLIPEIKQATWYEDQIIAMHTYPARKGTIVSLSDISDETKHALSQRNITHLYTHQRDAIEKLKTNNVIVSTQTASGKSLIYQLPLVAGLEQDSEFRAVFVFPTKALAQDQQRSIRQLLYSHGKLQDLLQMNPWFVSTYDGDTPRAERRDIAAHARVLLTNPDMIHYGMLGESSWRHFWKRTGLIVVDEVHSYTHVFGGHVSMVFRRLGRILKHLDTQAKWIGCSATLFNPGEHFQELVGLDSEPSVVAVDASPRGEKHHLIWTPPLLSPFFPSLGRRSALAECSVLVRLLMNKGVRVVVFCKFRKIVELVMKQILIDLKAHSSPLESKVVAYRAGYTATSRRCIEQNLFSGETLCVVSTTALELGVDIGTLDAVIHVGFPFSRASYVQQCGRVGRRHQDALSILIADEFDALGGYFIKNPEELWLGGGQVVTIDTLSVVEAHLQCAASEIPIQTSVDYEWFAPLELNPDIREEYPDLDHLQEWREAWFERKCQLWLRSIGDVHLPRGEFLPHPSAMVSIREMDIDVLSVYCGGKVIEHVEYFRAMFELFTGSVFLHQGNTHVVVRLDLDKSEAFVEKREVAYVTEPRDLNYVSPTRTRFRLNLTSDKIVSGHDSHQGEEGTWAFWGKVRLETRVFGYFKVDPYTRKVLEACENVEMPAFIRDTHGLWMDISSGCKGEVECLHIDLEWAHHAASHALLSIAYKEGFCGLYTECKHAAQTRVHPLTIMLYDSQSSNVSFRCFKRLKHVIELAIKRVRECQCEDGCIDCVLAPSCKENNVGISRQGGLIILQSLLSRV
jgi:DEAD/DEAH box helicase domain-containing protein